VFLETELQTATGLAYIRQFAGIACKFVYAASVVVWCITSGVRLYEL
jgi:hypothetical protein